GFQISTLYYEKICCTRNMKFEIALACRTEGYVFSAASWVKNVGVTRGMLKDRMDDFYLLKSEIRWNIEKQE
ncbi:MAG: hypothetical protein KAI95_15930, partial [Bacteroidales bacterium]|nr:hypothetical protein [Bacteroidales bacterium]